MSFFDSTDPGSLLLRRILLRGGAVLIAGIAILVAPSVERWWAEMTSTCTKVITPDDLVTLGGKKVPVAHAFDSEFFCDVDYGTAAGVWLDKDISNDKQDETWLKDAQEDGATIETLVDGAVWLALDGKVNHVLIVKREKGAAKVTLKKEQFSAEQARKLYPLIKDRWAPVDEYFAAK